MFRSGDIFSVQVTKATRNENSGLTLKKVNGAYTVDSVSGLFQNTKLPIKKGDKILQLNGLNVKHYDSIHDIYEALNNERRHITLSLERPKICQGDIMQLEGLQNMTSCNGKLVEIVGRDRMDANRWLVKLIDDSHSGHEKPIIRQGDIMQLHGLRNMTSCNGKLVEIVGRDRMDANRWLVKLVDDSHSGNGRYSGDNEGRVPSRISISSERLAHLPLKGNAIKTQGSVYRSKMNGQQVRKYAKSTKHY